MLVIGDVGGTKTRVAIAENISGGVIKTVTLKCADFDSFADLLKKACADLRITSPTHAVFGVPGPVSEGKANLTNIPWSISEEEISQSLETSMGAKLFNDLALVAAAIPSLKDEDLFNIRPGRAHREKKMFVVIAPGTGLGVSFLHHDGERYLPFACEAGHIEFAPTDDLQAALHSYLRQKLKRVSMERIASGMGLVNIYNFLKDSEYAPEPPELRDRLENEDPAAVIASTGEKGEYKITSIAMDLFASALGSFAGDLVFAYLATGGVYLGGGIPPKIMKKLSDGVLVSSFMHKGRLTDLVASTPINIIKDDMAALQGALNLARGNLGIS